MGSKTFMGNEGGRGPLGDASFAGEVAESCHAMARHALATGRAIPEWTVELLAGVESGSDAAAERLPDLVRAHGELAAIVAPARPEALLLLERERRRGGILRSLGPVRLVRQLIVASVLFLAAFVASSLSPYVDDAGGDIFATSGYALLANQLFLLSAAGVGACFAALFRVNRYLTEGTYDPRYDASYWIRFLLGLIAGVVLAALIPVEGEFTRPLLALGGGFAAPVVYRILTRIVEGLESVGGPGKKEPAPAVGTAPAAARPAPAPATPPPPATTSAAAAGPAVAAVATDEGATAVVAAAAPGAAGPPPPSAPPTEIPPELEGQFRARIVIDGGHVGAARVLDGPAIARAALGKLKTVARAAAVAKLGSEITGPFGDLLSDVVGGDASEEMAVVVEDGVATGALHEWASGRGEAPGREVAVDLYDAGVRSSTLKLEDSRVQEYESEEDPDNPGSYIIRKLVLVPANAEWLVGALDPIDEARKLFAQPADAPAPPPPPRPAPCRGSFARGAAAGVLLALALAGLYTVGDDGKPVVDVETPTPAPCPEDGGPAATACPPDTVAPYAPRASHIPSPTLPPEETCVPRSDCPSPSIPPSPCAPPACPPTGDPPCPTDPCPFITESPVIPSPSPVISCPPVGSCPPIVTCPPTGTCDPVVESPSPPPVPSPSPLPPRRCKQPPGAVIRSQAHARHPGCALYHSEAEPPGHGGPMPGSAPPPAAPTPPPPGAPAPARAVAPVATAPPQPRSAPRHEEPEPPAPAPAPEPENAPALPPGLAKRKDGLPPGLEKKRRAGRPRR
ncbi:MAG TPA: hypothetical protein VHI71_06555 [Actinomycetota bacterium]|nr:hypothetical protein [Actinomycetota bacterium]